MRGKFLRAVVILTIEGADSSGDFKFNKEDIL